MPKIKLTLFYVAQSFRLKTFFLILEYGFISELIHFRAKYLQLSGREAQNATDKADLIFRFQNSQSACKQEFELHHTLLPVIECFHSAKLMRIEQFELFLPLTYELLLSIYRHY